MGGASRLFPLAFVGALCACLRGPDVDRVYGGAPVAERYIDAAAYSAFLRATIADAAGHPAEAVVAYREAVRSDPGAACAMTVSGTVSCRLAGCAPTPLAKADDAPVVATRDAVRAWEATRAWAATHDDLALRVAALEALSRAGPAHREMTARAAEDLAGFGDIGLAWALAAAAVDASHEPLSENRGLVGRLAVDEAIARGDAGLVRARATRARIGLGEAASRALLADQLDVARALSAAESLADPQAIGARLVLAAAGGADAMNLLASGSTGDPISAAEWVAYGEAVRHLVPRAVARSLLAGLAHDSLLGTDDRVVHAAVGLAWRGLIDEASLPETGRVELAVIEGRSDDALVEDRYDEGALDARHVALLRALEAATDPTRELAVETRAFVRVDSMLAGADALVDLASRANLPPGSARALLDRDPGDPLVAAVALRVAAKTGETEVSVAARTVLASFPALDASAPSGR